MVLAGWLDVLFAAIMKVTWLGVGMQTSEETAHRRHMQTWRHNVIHGGGKQSASQKENWRIQ